MKKRDEKCSNQGLEFRCNICAAIIIICVHSFRFGYVIEYNGKWQKSINAHCKQAQYKDTGEWKHAGTDDRVKCKKGNACFGIKRMINFILKYSCKNILFCKKSFLLFQDVFLIEIAWMGRNAMWIHINVYL